MCRCVQYLCVQNQLHNSTIKLRTGEQNRLSESTIPGAGPGVPEPRGGVSGGGAEQGPARGHHHAVHAVHVPWKWRL